ncbi:MAG TPA: GNAT family N-acetyltransferase [Gammaproteobacteria bacterium]|nr:GNAT family N-acetyltransferase [Gammaproteobacteria bacterium]
MEWTRDNYTITDDPKRLDREVIWRFLSTSYWAKNVPAATVDKSLANSLCFTLLDGMRQVGFARVISDRATIAYLADVFVLDEYRGRGLGTWLVGCVLEHPDLQGLRRWILATLDAHDLYRKVGFTALKNPARFMELHNPNVYGGP